MTTMQSDPATTEHADAIRQTKGYVHYYGRPEWLGDMVLDLLCAEAARVRPRAIQVGRQAHSGVGEIGREVSRSARVMQLIAERAGPVRASGSANYLYYDEPKAGIDPHIDGPDFPLQILLMLEHTGYTEPRSALVVFPDGPKSAVRLPLEPGELVLFSAASVYHGRTSVGAGERLLVAGFGYVPA
jgi:hypothetical protein